MRKISPARNVGFVLRPYPDHSLLKFCEEVRPAIVIGDENPMREPEQWRVKVAKKIRVPLWTVDADVIVPSKLLLKEQFGARTIRPRIHALLPKFMVRQKILKAHVRWMSPPALAFAPRDEDFISGWKLDRSVGHGSGLAWRKQAGAALASANLCAIVWRTIPRPATILSKTAPAGFLLISILDISVRTRLRSRCSAAMRRRGRKQAFLEQVIVRRELAVNFVRFNPAYDSFECLEPWAQRSLAEHARDPRAVLYSEEQLEQGATHDPLWNAAQKQMVLTGWMHNYLRMYWAKKILEWSPSVSAAYQRAVRLNDRYELDGRDPNGYAGIAWAIVGKHDRAWSDRPVYGKIRYMSLASTGRNSIPSDTSSKLQSWRSSGE